MRFRKLHLLIAILTFTMGLGSMALVRYAERVMERRYPLGQIAALPSRSLFEDRLEEQAVYRAIIHSRHRESTPKLIVIQATSTKNTSYENTLAEEAPTTDILKEFRETDLEKEATDDYLVKNEVSSQLEIGNLGMGYILISDDEINRYFGDGRLDWQSFYKKYRGSSGFLSFSRVGFNKAHNQAFVYAAHACGGLCGAGGYLILEKRGSDWIITRSEGVWVS